MGIDAEAGWQCGREGKGIASGGSVEVARDIKREAMALVGTLICDGGGGRAAVADGKMEALADRHPVGVSRGHRDRIVRRNRGDCEQAVLSGIRSPVWTEGLDELIITVLVEYIV